MLAEPVFNEIAESGFATAGCCAKVELIWEAATRTVMTMEVNFMVLG
jgi:hypothetical protein